MNPYRQAPLPETRMLGPRWGVTTWKKFYVRYIGQLFDIKQKYLFERANRRYQRNLIMWLLEWGPDSQVKPITMERFKYLKKHRPPMPLPPPIQINE